MKGISRFEIFLVAAVVVSASVAIWSFVRAGGRSESRDEAVTSYRSGGVPGREVSGRKERKKPRQKGERRAVRNPIRMPVSKPDFLSDTSMDPKFNAEMRKLLLDIQAALDMDDAKRVYALVHKLQLMDEWPDGIPRSVKMKALDALAWFGANGMSEAIGFLADSDVEVRQTAIEKFEEMMSDMDIGDKALSDILSQVVKVVHDHDALDSFFMEMDNMRDTVKGKSAQDVYASGNHDAIEVLEENFEFIFDRTPGDSGREIVDQFVKDAEQVYKDDPSKIAEDELLYGPNKKWNP